MKSLEEPVMCLLTSGFIIQVLELEIVGRGAIPELTIFNVTIVDEWLPVLGTTNFFTPDIDKKKPRC